MPGLPRELQQFFQLSLNVFQRKLQNLRHVQCISDAFNAST